jgi:hypothetical protein
LNQSLLWEEAEVAEGQPWGSICKLGCLVDSAVIPRQKLGTIDRLVNEIRRTKCYGLRQTWDPDQIRDIAS